MTFIEAVTHPSFVLGEKWAMPMGSTDKDDVLHCSPEGFLIGIDDAAPLISVEAIVEPWTLIYPEKAPLP